MCVCVCMYVHICVSTYWVSLEAKSWLRFWLWHFFLTLLPLTSTSALFLLLTCSSVGDGKRHFMKTKGFSNLGLNKCQKGTSCSWSTEKLLCDNYFSRRQQPVCHWISKEIHQLLCDLTVLSYFHFRRLLFSPCRSVRMGQLCFHWMDFHKIWYLKLSVITSSLAKLYFWRRSLKKHSSVSMQRRSFYVKKYVKFYCSWRHKFTLKPLLCNNQYFYIFDSDV